MCPAPRPIPDQTQVTTPSLPPPTHPASSHPSPAHPSSSHPPSARSSTHPPTHYSYARSAADALDGALDAESLERDFGEESGWKLVHGDVFRPPRQLTLLAAAVGTGVQLVFLCLAVILLTIAGSFFEERGTILTCFIIAYTFTSFIGGFRFGREEMDGLGVCARCSTLFTSAAAHALPNPVATRPHSH